MTFVHGLSSFFAERKMNFWHFCFKVVMKKNKDRLHKTMFALTIELPYLCVNLQ